MTTAVEPPAVEPAPASPCPADLGAATGGVWTRAEALACGWSDDVIAHRVAVGYWQRLRRGVFCDGGILPSAAMSGWAAVLASGGRGGPGPTGERRCACSTCR